MAEMVQTVMDGMVPALRDLMDNGIFSESEVRAIVSRRRESEYLLRRRVARKADFLRYAEAEMTLEQLRKLRNKQIKRKRKGREDHFHEGPRKERTTIGDGSIIRNIHFIMSRATRKWRNDVSLFLLHAEYAKKTKSFRMLGKIYAEALQVHPKNSDLWIEAASYEFFGYLDANESTYGGSIQNARVLMQRGIRVNPMSQQLYLQYFSLEWHYAQKLRGRREILQLTQEENQNPLVPWQQVSQNDNNNGIESDVSNSTLYTGAVPLVIYKMAIKKIPHDVTFRLKFLSICDLFPQTTDVKKQIMESIERDFSNLPDAWIARAVYVTEHSTYKDQRTNGSEGFFVKDSELKDGEKNQSINMEAKEGTESMLLQILDKATSQIPTSEMYLKCVSFIESRFEFLEKALKFLFSKAQKAQIQCPELKSKWVSYLMKTGNIIKSEKVLREATLASANVNNYDDSKNTLLWLQYADLIHKMDGIGLLPQLIKEYENEPKAKQPPSNALVIFRAALIQFPLHDPSHVNLLIAFFKYLLANNIQDMNSDEEIGSIFTRILLLKHKEDSVLSTINQNKYESIPDLSLMYLKYASALGGLPSVRKVYEAVLCHSSCVSNAGDDERKKMKKFFRSCIALEKLSVTDPECMEKGKKRRKLKHDNLKFKGRNDKLMRLYDRIIGFYKVGNDNATANYYSQMRLDDIGSS